MTTFDPGASEVLTHGFDPNPRSTAFLARSPAAIITEGFDVFVQLVMAAITTWPWSRANSVPSSLPPDMAGGSLAGKDRAEATSGSSGAPSGTTSPRSSTGRCLAPGRP